MKAGLFIAAAMASVVVSSKHNHGHSHAAFHKSRGLAGTGPASDETCSTVYYTTTGIPAREFYILNPPIYE
jgi:hypothetical protein